MLHHTRGSHNYYARPDLNGYVLISMHGKILPPKTLKSILSQANLTVEAFIELL
jgi:predicted RNA binding protein YcfA (HicA-like mRNA interferase family)